MSILNEFNLFSLAKRTGRPLILDGAMGSLLQQRGVDPHPQLWMSHANLLYPERVLSIHREYIDAGADIISTNTFRTNPAASEHGREQLKAAVNLAKEAASGLPVLVAGSNAPAEDCYQRERKLTISKLEYNHCKHIDLLTDNGSDLILNETMSHFDEIKIISDYCGRSRIPFIISLFFDNNLNLLSGEKVIDILPYIWEHGPLAIGFNCIMPSDFKKLLPNIPQDYITGFYLNCGSGTYEDKDIKCGIHPEEYSSYVLKFLGMNPAFIGACCGSSPEHIKKLRNIFNNRYDS